MAYNKLTHIVHKQVFEIHLPYSGMEREITERLLDAYHAAFPRVEALLNTFDDPDRIIQIERIYLDLGNLQLDKFEEVFSARLCDALSEMLTHTGAINKKLCRGAEAFPEKTPAIISYDTPIQEFFNDFDLESAVKSYSVPEGLGHALIYFLRNGVFPWWQSDKHEEVLDSIFAPVMENPSPGFVDHMKRLLSHDQNALQRLASHFSDEFLERLIILLEGKTRDSIGQLCRVFRSLCSAHGLRKADARMHYRDHQRIIEILITPDSQLKEQLMYHARHWINEGVFSFDDLKEHIHSGLHASSAAEDRDLLADLKTRLHSRDQSDQVKSSDVSFSSDKLYTQSEHDEVSKDAEWHDESIHVSYAGLVILHPFLQYFFADLHLLDDEKKFLSESARSRAVYLLGFLASGKEDVGENRLPFCKYLCGFPLKVALEKPLALEHNAKEECEKLLQSVVGHWTALKGTSSDGLREAFLSRKGKLELKDGNPVLYVERMAYDILLERLPWGIGYIQLPWLKEPLVTSWN